LDWNKLIETFELREIRKRIKEKENWNFGINSVLKWLLFFTIKQQFQIYNKNKKVIKKKFDLIVLKKDIFFEYVESKLAFGFDFKQRAFKFDTVLQLR
jgi:hypothetical protein